ncbi:hypothetical protein Poli38472_006356 [Pythium oligandrum]|uniref:Uncharacterized protein n=1 Tax=Pythium oligandrum TaxID=41045 RepID=A0A8K1C4G1_PYTOL|nr:hypothetical protein Poli38472_006356 [Pythium oligandrum]|eukprot:TMW56346.1 hypothetical protein Poli38472_006356 [Pythium oligandrum]
MMLMPPSVSTRQTPSAPLDRMRLLFSTQLHHQLQTIARSRELTTRAAPRNGHSNGNGNSAAFTAPVEVNGWEVEKKMVLLQDIRVLLEQPCFFYSDCGSGLRPSCDPKAPHATASVGMFFSVDSYFNKTLPLLTGQHSLLDVWAYLLDMSEFVSVRNRCRSLYLHIAICIARRVEFIHGATISGDKVVVESHVRDRYYHLFERCISLCTKKLVQSSFLLEENALFMAHIYAMICFRFPSRSGRIFDAVVESTRVLEQTSVTPLKRNRRRSQSEPFVRDRQSEDKLSRALEGSRSPRETRRHWHAMTDESTEHESANAQQQLNDAFLRYKLTRRNSLSSTFSFPNLTSLPRRSIESTLQQALEADLKAESTPDAVSPAEAAFLQEMAVLRAFSGAEHHTLQHGDSFQEVLDLGLERFVDRLRRPDRDDLLVLPFVGAFLSNVSFWWSATRPQPDEKLLWHCVPGYFCVIRAFAAVFKRMCQRRARQTTTSAATIGNILSIVEGRGADLWVSYWTNREINSTMDVLSEVLKNPRLVDVFVEIVLEGTNILDPMSVNYSLSILQRVVQVGVVAAAVVNPRALLTNGTQRPRTCLSESFDDAYFCNAMRTALQSSHVQILLKALTFLYSCLDALPAKGRRLLIGELVLRENFFRLFLHWNDEIRKIYSYIIVFKLFSATRLDLPMASDRVLLARTPFFEVSGNGTLGNGSAATSAVSPTSPSFGYWSHLSDLAQSMLKSPTSKELLSEQRKYATAQAMPKLLTWDASATLHRTRAPRRDSLFHASLENEDLSVDLLVASKLDASFKMLADQIGKRLHATTSSNGIAKHPTDYFPVEQEAYAERAVAQYVNVLWEYYCMAVDRPNALPPAPKLEFTIASPYSTD